MPSDFVDAVSKLVSTPPAHVALCGLLAGGVWKFFTFIEGLLTENSKFEIAVWLVGVNTSSTWRKALSAFLRTIIGANRQCVLPFAFVTGLIATVFVYTQLSSWIYSLRFIEPIYSQGRLPWIVYLTLLLIQMNIALLCIVLAEAISANDSLGRKWIPKALFAPIAKLLTLVCLVAMFDVHGEVAKHMSMPQSAWTAMSIVFADFPVSAFVLSFIVSGVWLWLYFTAGLMIRLASRFDRTFQWLNRKVDIEKKPLQYIGALATALTVMLYWAFVGYF